MCAQESASSVNQQEVPAMPKTITLDGWKSAVSAIPFFKQSAQIKAITEKFGEYAVNPGKLGALKDVFKAWDTATTGTVPAERTKLATAREDLKYTLEHAGGEPTVRAAQVKPMGWTLKAWTQADYPWTSAVATADKLPDLTPSQIARVNEAMRRAKGGAEVARDAMLLIKRRNNIAASPLPAEEQAYMDYFRDPAHIQTVLDRFTILQLAFSRNPTVVDVRNTLYGMDMKTDGACFRENLTSRDATTHELALTGSVELFLCRGFFKGGGYVASTDVTVGTLVHEFSHGSFKAVDAPPVDANNNWILPPSTDAEDLWASPDNDQQSSTEEDDKLLAIKEPRAAIVNADNYGQFVKRLITQAQK
jgi:hypothetical protein